MGDSSWNGYERNCLFANDGGSGQFVDIARASGGDEIRDSRGVAVADFDGDGRLDLAMNNNNNVPALYWNRFPGGAALQLDLIGRDSNRDAVGTRVELTLANADGEAGKRLTRWVEAGSGYASQASHTLHFGLGDAPGIHSLVVHWPSGRVDRVDVPEASDSKVTRLRIEESGAERVAAQPVQRSQEGSNDA